jgi:hypothetical protein
MLVEGNEIRCWDISGWPVLNEQQSNNFAPPSPNCRGLWFDGEYFWTAESYESSLGQIYQFDYSGTVINQWLAPAFSGWGICVVTLNSPPVEPENPNPEDGAANVAVDASLSWTSWDPDGDEVTFDVYFGDVDPPVIVSSGQVDSLYDPPGDMSYGEDYYWKVVAWDSHGDSAASPTWSFSTELGYVCGDSDASDEVNVDDAVHLIGYIFVGGPEPVPYESGDADCSGAVDIGDIVWLITYIFSGGNEPCDVDGDGVPDC